jgi:tRNA G46 methylase TrmB
MDWSSYYPAFIAPQPSAHQDNHTTTAPEEGIQTMPKLVKDVEIADIGCGFGGLLVALAPRLPDQLLLGETLQPNYWT